MKGAGKFGFSDFHSIRQNRAAYAAMVRAVRRRLAEPEPSPEPDATVEDLMTALRASYGNPTEVAAANDLRLAALGLDRPAAPSGHISDTVPGVADLAAAKAAYDARTLRGPAAREAKAKAGETPVAESPRGFTPEVEEALDAYLRGRLKPPDKHPPASDTRWLGWIAAAAGGYVVVTELAYRGNSTLSPILIAVGIAIVCLAAAHLLRHGNP